MDITGLKNVELKAAVFGEDFLSLTLKDGKTLRYTAEGDCCSHSYIESLDNQDALQDATLYGVESVEGDEKTMEPDMDVHKWTFYKFKTSKGDCTLSFRNESNGYYNGSLEYAGEEAT